MNKFTIAILTTLALLPSLHTSQAGSATWNSSPGSSDWNTAANWTPATVPNGPSDIATFPNSNTANPIIHSSVKLNAIVFDSTLTAFTIAAGEAGGPDVASLTLSGAGIVNNSGASIQAVQAAPTLATNGRTNVIAFSNTATIAAQEGAFSFLTALGGGTPDLVGGEIKFFDNSTAGSATLEADKGQNGGPGRIFFFDNSAAVNGQIVNIAGNAGTAPGSTTFTDASTAGAAVVENNPASAAGVLGGSTTFLRSSTAGDSVISAHGGNGGNAGGGVVVFADTSSAGNAILNGDSGTNGGFAGSIQFLADSTGGTAAIVGSGNLMISNHNPPGITIGSLEGGGNVFLGSNNLTVGTDLSKTYFGVMKGSGSLTKNGSGLLILGGANTYTGGTTINAGALRTNNTIGSATGSGPVSVNAGNLGGEGMIVGPVTIGSGTGPGAILEPGVGSSGPRRLTLQSSLTFKADGDYACQLNTKTGRADQVITNGVVIENGAQYAFGLVGNKPLNLGKVFTVISNTSTNPISGTFANLVDGSILTFGKNSYQVSYEGGDGNDLTLTVVP